MTIMTGAGGGDDWWWFLSEKNEEAWVSAVSMLDSAVSMLDEEEEVDEEAICSRISANVVAALRSLFLEYLDYRIS